MFVFAVFFGAPLVEIMFSFFGSLCGSSKRPIDPSLVPSPAPAPTPVQDVSSTVIQDVSSTVIQDVSSSVIQDVSSIVIQDVSSTPVQEDEPCPIDLSGTDRIIEKIDEVLREIPVIHSEDLPPSKDLVETAIAALWLPPRPEVVVTGSPMSRATTRG